ncbi:hypothetical protein OG21DRAFT_1417779 [Imleria badia]|nr:hypothetical protein OG21DRAFT_1417779 [Imleria badia]
MFANAKALLVIASCALVAQAQSSATAPPSPSSTAGLDSCIIDCVTPAAAAAGCGSYTNLTCTCTSTDFQQASLQCLQANCTATDLQTAEQMQGSACGGCK